MRNDNYAEFERKDRNGCSLTLIVLKFKESNLVKYVLFMQLISIIFKINDAMRKYTWLIYPYR